jgi:hypothetical protein
MRLASIVCRQPALPPKHPIVVVDEAEILYDGKVQPTAAPSPCKREPRSDPPEPATRVSTRTSASRLCKSATTARNKVRDFYHVTTSTLLSRMSVIDTPQPVSGP